MKQPNATNRMRILTAMSVLLIAGVMGWNLLGQSSSATRSQTTQLRHAQAQRLADPLANVLRGVDPEVKVEVDANANRITITGSDEALQVARQLLQTLDRPLAETPATAARGYTVPPEQLNRMADELRRRFASRNDVRITADERTNQLVVVAPVDVHDQIQQLLASGSARDAQSDVPQLAPARGSSGTGSDSARAAGGRLTVVLRHLAWQDLEAYLKETFGERLQMEEASGGEFATLRISMPSGTATLQIDRVQQTVHVFAPADQLPAWRQMLQLMDDVTRQRQAARLVSLQHSEPGRVEQAVARLRQAARAENTPGVRITDLNETRPTSQPVQEVPDTAQPQPQPGIPGEQPMVPGQEQPPTGDEEAEALLQNVRIEFIPELGIVVVIGPRRAVERVRRIIAEIEEISRTVQPTFEIVMLRHLNSQAAATLLVELYDRVFAPRQGPLSITSLDKPNALLLIGRPETMEVVLQLIERLDQPIPPQTQLRVFRLKHISAVDAEALVRGFFVDRPAGPVQAGAAADPRPGLGTRARVIAEYRTNSLIVQASPRDLAEVAYFIASIDREAPDATHEVRVFRLRNARAQDLAPVLQGAITGRPVQVTGQQVAQVAAAPGQAVAPQITAPSTRLAIVGIDSAGNRIIDSGVLADVTVSADVSINALIVRAPSRSMGLVEELIKQLDQPPIAEAVVKVFEIANGDATSLAQMLQTLFGLPTTAQGLGGLAGALQAQGAAFAVSAAAAGESALVPLRFAVDVRTNSIIASGTASDLAVVETLLLRLDAADVDERQMFVYRLLNAPANEVATAIANFLNQQRTIYQQNLLFNQTVSQIEQLEREIIVVPEAVTNSLIVSVTPRYREQIMEIIKALDFRPPMVMVQVMICEVQLKDAFEFGVEMGLQDSLVFDRGVAAGTNVVPNSSPFTIAAGQETFAGQAITGFGLGRTSASLGYGGLVLSAANESINVLIRALQDAGRLQVLSRPTVMTLDAQPAFVQVGARVPRITGTTITQGIVQNQTQDTDVGILLRIQPRVNQDGLIVMVIDTEKSEVGPREQGIPIAVDQQGNPILSPQINTTTAQATISAYSGQTVVFAGLITKNRSIASKRIPFLSDLPLVGRLFRFDAESETRTELLIFLTPYVIREDQDYEWLKHVESQRMSWCLADVVEMHGDVGLSGGHGLWGPANIPLIFPDLDPTGQMAVPAEPVVPGAAAPSPAGQPTPPPPPNSPPGNGQLNQSLKSNQSSRRGAKVTSVKTWLGPKPAPQLPPLVPAQPSSPAPPQNQTGSGPQLTPASTSWQPPASPLPNGIPSTTEVPPGAVAPAGYLPTTP
ncbi:MAG: general secretion pathway protein GspD [Pirellulaceae bacterium]|nr:MAG: general secretion pathway protein GspD [Pirellulaceae bacterium]